MERMKKDLPEDVETSYGFDNTKFIRASINEVESTVYEAFFLVIVIIFLFLRDWRVTLVPCVVIPVSLIGSFFVMYLAGFSINVLSMLAVVLAVGLVVDDAIVMTENIYIRIERGMSPKEAGIEGAKEIFFAVISTTITLVAVFFPIVFMEGMTGRLFREFSLVVAGAVIISAFSALTFTPMLATKAVEAPRPAGVVLPQDRTVLRRHEPFLQPHAGGVPAPQGARLPDRAGDGRHHLRPVEPDSVEMAPLEDRSMITINTRGPEGVTYEYIRDYTEDINRLVDTLVPESRAVTARVSSGSGNVQIALKDITERQRSQMDIAEQLSKAVKSKTMARAFVQQQSTFGGRRGSMPIQYVLQATNLEKLQEVLPEFMARVYDNPTFQMADVNLKFSKPEARISINRDKSNLMGVSTRDIAQTLQYGLSGQRMGYFYMNGKQYEILGEINRQQRNKPVDLKSIYIRSDKGEMIQLDNLVSLAEGIAPPQLYRYNRFVSATISAGLAEGKTIGQGLDEMDKIAKRGTRRHVPHRAGRRLERVPRKFVEPDVRLRAGHRTDLPDPRRPVRKFQRPVRHHADRTAGCRRSADIYVRDRADDEYFQPDRDHHADRPGRQERYPDRRIRQPETGTGVAKMQAIEEAALQRLRPILMTSASTILGLLPLAFATGEGANGRITMGIAVVGGMLVSTIMTLYIVPAIYTYVSTNRLKKQA